MNLVRCFTEDTTTVVTEPLMRYAVSVTEPHASQQNITNIRPQYLFVSVCFLVAMCFFSLVNVHLYVKMRKLKELTARNMDPEQSVPLTAAISQS
jgi:bacteriorhodopsin